jgi:Mn-dependent DtxR family transcriptional regulator
MIIKELSYSGKAMTTKQIAKAIDYLQERTEVAVKRLESEGKLIRNSSGLWEVSVIAGTSFDSVAAAAG